MNKHVAAGLLLVLAGCQQNAPVREDTHGRFLRLDGASVVIKRELQISAGRARVYVQNDGMGVGEHTGSGGFDSYRPHCAFEITRVDHAGFEVETGHFMVTRIQQTVDPVVRKSQLMVAAVGLLSGMDGGGGSQAYYAGYHFWLSSEEQPEVLRMSCYGVYAQPYELYPPTLQEINAALGAVAELRY